MTDATRTPRIVVAGAGAVGCFVGGHLAAAGRDVALLGRERIAREVDQHGLLLTDRDGGRVALAPGSLAVATDPASLASADVVLVTVKSSGTRGMAQAIRAHAPAGVVVVSLQNGVDNAAILAAELPAQRVFAGMVPFNVAALGEGRFHRGTDGALVIDAGAATTAVALDSPRLPVRTHPDMTAVAWGKLLLNLNNALNALAGIPLRDELADRRWRRVLAACIDEALAALAAAAVRPSTIGSLPPAWLPTVLRLPDPLFRIVAARQLRIDPIARSSMADDLALRRTTEVDQLQGAVIALAAARGLDAPTNRAVLDRIHLAERSGTGSPRIAPGDLLR